MAGVVEMQWLMPRTERGHPSLEGARFFSSRTPFQWPSKLGYKATYNKSEVVELERKMQAKHERQDDALDAKEGASGKGARKGQEADDAFLAHFLEAKIV
jgi:hypothetical protein